MTIEVTYNVTDIYISSEVSPIYIDVNYQTSGGGATVWGGITGTLSNQTDLQTALDLKLDESTIDGGSEGQILTKNSATDFDFAWIDNYAKYMATNVRNQTGSTIDSFKVVYISGATGNKPLITLSDADTEVTSSKTYGVTKQSIANNGTGDVVTAGELSGIDTSAFAEGDRLWLSSTPGGVVTSPPAEPAHSVFIGTVIRSHPTLGIVDVNIQNGYELTELHGVQITSETNNQGLFYDGSSSLWVNKSIPTVLGYTPEQPLTFSSPLSRLVNAVSIPAATSSVNGYLSSTDWSTFNGKENALTFSSPLSRSTNTISIPQATSSVSGFLSSTDWSTFNSKQGALTLTTTGTSGAATLVGNTLNIPQYSGGGISGSGTSGQVTFWNGTSSITGSNDFQWDGNNINLASGKGIILQRTGTNRNISIVSGNVLDNFAAAFIYPSSGTNVASSLSISTRGTGFSAAIKSQIVLFNTDFVADSVNYELAVFRAGGTNFSLSTGKDGTGTIRPLLLSAGFATDAITNGNQLWLYTTGNVGINTSSDSGFKLDVNGTARIQGNLTTNLTSGSVPFIGTSGVLAQNNANFFWDNTNVRLGIGTSSPTARFHVLYSNFSDVAVFERTPSFNNDLASSAILRGGYSSVLDNGGPSFSFQLRVGTTINDIASFGARRDGADNSGSLSFLTVSAGTQSEKMSIRASGNVLINTTTDSGFKLDVNGTARFLGPLILNSSTNTGERLQVTGAAKITSKLSMSAGTTSNAQINLASSTAPTSPNNGDIWFTGTDLKIQVGGVTKTFTLI